MSASGMLKKLFMLRYSISTMRTIVASPEKLHRLCNERDPNLYLDGVGTLPIEVSKREVLFYLLEKRLYLPPPAVDSYDSLHGHVKVVGKQGHQLWHLSLLDIHIGDDTCYMVDTALPEHHPCSRYFISPSSFISIQSANTSYLRFFFILVT